MNSTKTDQIDFRVFPVAAFAAKSEIYTITTTSRHFESKCWTKAEVYHDLEIFRENEQAARIARELVCKEQELHNEMLARQGFDVEFQNIYDYCKDLRNKLSEKYLREEQRNNALIIQGKLVLGLIGTSVYANPTI